MDEKIQRALAYITKKKNAVGKKLNKDQSLFETCGEYKSSDTQWENWCDEAETLNFVEALLKQGEEVKNILAEYGLETKDFREACLLLRQWRGEKLCWIDYEKLKSFARLMFDFVNYNPINGEYWFSDCIVDAKDKAFKLVDGLARDYFMKHEDEYNKLLIGELEKPTITELEYFIKKIPTNAEMSIIEESQGDFISFRIVYKVPKAEEK